MAHVPRPMREVFTADLPIAICSIAKLSLSNVHPTSLRQGHPSSRRDGGSCNPVAATVSTANHLHKVDVGRLLDFALLFLRSADLACGIVIRRAAALGLERSVAASLPGTVRSAACQNKDR